MTKMHDLNDLKLLTCDNCEKTSRVLFPTMWRYNEFNISHICPRCLWEWVKLGKFDEDYGKAIEK